MKVKMKMKAEGNPGEVVSAIRPGMKKLGEMMSAGAAKASAPKKLKLKVK